MITINGEDLTKRIALNRIYQSYQNDQIKQACDWIEEYGVYDFWSDFKDFLYRERGMHISFNYGIFSDLTIAYFRIKGR